MKSRKTPIQWLLSGDTGTSSMTLLAGLMRTEYAHPSVPLDVDDFGRCYRMATQVEVHPSLLANDIIRNVVTTYPIWGPYAARWDDLCRLYAIYANAQTDANYGRVQALLNEAASVLRARNVPPVAKPEPESAAGDGYEVVGYVAGREELCRTFGALQEAKAPRVVYLPCAPKSMAAEAAVQTQLAIERAIAHLKKALPDGAYRKLMGDEQQ